MKERIMRILHAAAIMLAVLGVLVVLGTAGGSDYADEVGEVYPMTDILRGLSVGLALMIPAFITSAIERRNEQDKQLDLNNDVILTKEEINGGIYE